MGRLCGTAENRGAHHCARRGIEGAAVQPVQLRLRLRLESSSRGRGARRVEQLLALTLMIGATRNFQWIQPHIFGRGHLVSHAVPREQPLPPNPGGSQPGCRLQEIFCCCGTAVVGPLCVPNLQI
jgi:hypothetical protein